MGGFHYTVHLLTHVIKKIPLLNGWDPMFVIRAISLSEKLMIGVGFVISDIGWNINVYDWGPKTS